VKRVGDSQINVLTKLTEVARLTSDSVNDCSGYALMPSLNVIEILLSVLCDENLHFNEMKLEFNENNSFTSFIIMFVSFYQDCTRP
jgi:hypothetical protein